MGRTRKKQEKIYFRRNLIVMTVLIVLLGVITAHSMNMYRNYAEQYYTDLEQAVGYQVEGTVYTLQDAEQEHYLSFALPENIARSFFLYFNSANISGSEDSTSVSATLYEQDQVVGEYTSSIPASDAYVRILFPNTQADHIRISVDGTFDLNSAVREVIVKNEHHTQELMYGLIAGGCVCLWIAAYFLAGKRRVNRWLSQMQERCQVWGQNIRKDRRRNVIMGIQFLICLAAGSLIWLVLFLVKYEKMGQRWDWDDYLFGCMTGLVLFFVMRFVWYRKMQFEQLFLFCGMTLSAALTILLPLHLNIAWDDQLHYLAAVTLSKFNSSHISLSEYTYYLSCFYPQLKSSPSDTAAVLNDAAAAVTHYMQTDVALTYKSVVYLPVSLAIFFFRGIFLPFSICVILGRMAGAWFYFYVIYRGMRHLRSGKAVVAVAALIPTGLFLVTNYNYDYWLIAWVSYSMCYLIGEYQTPEKYITVRDLVYIFGSFLIGIIVKPVYIPLLGIAAFLPNRKFSTEKFRKIYHGIFLGLVLIAAAGFAFLVFGGGLGQGDTRGGEEINAPEQIRYILAYPVVYIKMLLSFLKNYLSFWNLRIYSADLAYVTINGCPTMPIMILMLLAVLLDRNRHGAKIGWYVPVSVIPLVFVSICMVATAMYVVFTPVGADYISGCQGRYLLPLVSPFLLILSRLRVFALPWTEKSERWMQSALLLYAAVLCGRMILVFMG